MAKSNRRQSRELRLLQEDSCFEETMNVKRSEFKCNECSLSFHRKTSYDSHVMINHKKKDEMAEIWKQLDKPDLITVKLKPKPDKIQIVNSNLKHKIVVGLDGKVVKKYKAGIVELRKNVKELNATDVIKSGTVRLMSPSTSGHKATPIAVAKSTWNNLSVNFDKKGIQCLNCKHYFKNSFEFGVHTTRVEHRVPCQICFQSFENQCHLKRHQRIAHPHVCNMCDKLFSTQQNLDVHRKVSHRMIFQTMKADNSKQMTSTGSKSNSKQLTTIVISDSDSDETAKKSNSASSHKVREASGSDFESISKKHKLSAKDMMQSLASIAQSKETKDPFSNMLSVMLEKPPLKRAPSVIFTTSKPVMGMQMTQSAKKPVQPVQNKVVTLNPSIGTTTGLSSFLGQHVTSTVYSNLRPKGSFNLGKQVERVNLACRLAQHKQSLELKRLLKRHPQYTINDRDLKFKIPLGNLNEEFDECPLFPREADIKLRTSDYTISPLSVIDDTDYLESFGLNSNVMQRMFSEAVDSCVLQEAWKLTHSTVLRKRSREVTSYSLKQKQECILDLHVQLLAIRNAAQTIVNKALVKHITGLRQAGKQVDPTIQVRIDQPSNIQLVGQVSQNELTTPKTKSYDGNDGDQNNKDLKSGQNAVESDNNKVKSDSASTQDGCTETGTNQPTPNQLSTNQPIGDVNHSLTDHATNSKKNPTETSESQTTKDTNLEANSDSNGIKDSIKEPEEVNMEGNSCEKVVEKKDVNGISAPPEITDNQEKTQMMDDSFVKIMTGVETDLKTCNKQVEEISGEKNVKNKDGDIVLIDGDSMTGTNLKEQAVNATVDNKMSNSEMPIVSLEESGNQGTTEIINIDKQSSGEKNDSKTSNEQEVEMKKLDKLQALTEELMKAIPATKSGETIYTSEVQISSEYCGLIGKGHYNGMDFRWIVQFARPYVNTLLMHRKQECTNGEGSHDRNEKVVNTNINETSIEQASSSKSVQKASLGTTIGSVAAGQANIPSSQTSTFAVNNTTSVFNSDSQPKMEIATMPVVAQMRALPSLTGFPFNAVQPLAAAPVALSQSPVAIHTLCPQSKFSVPILSPKSSDVAPLIFSQPSTPALLHMLPIERPAQPTLTNFASILPAVQSISTNILLSRGLQQVQNSAIVNGIITRNSTICVPTGIAGIPTGDGSQITSIPHIAQKDLRPILPKSSPGFLTLTSKNVAVLQQEVLLQTTGYNQQQLYTLAATNPIATNYDFVPTTQDSNQLPSEARTFPIHLDYLEEPKKKYFVTVDDCLEFEAGEIVLFNDDIQNGKVPRFHKKKLFKCEVAIDHGCEKNKHTLTFLNSLYNIKKMYITGHLSKDVYQKLIPIAQIIACSSIQLHVKRTYTLLVETILKQAQHNSAEDIDRIHTVLLDVLNTVSRRTHHIKALVKNRKSGTTGLNASIESKEATKVIAEVETCGLQICLTDLKLPGNQSTVLVTEKKNTKNEHIGFVIKNKTGASFKKDLLTEEDCTRKRSHVEEEETCSAIKDTKRSKVKGDKNEMETTKTTKQTNDNSNDCRQHRPREQPIRIAEGTKKLSGPRKEKSNNEQDQCDAFVVPDETDPEIEFASPSPQKRKKSGHKK